MAQLETIKSYLVSLGFSVTQGELRKFQDTLKTVTQDVERVTAGLAKGFTIAGATIAGVLTGVGVGVLDLMNNVARSDLGFQVLARRMYMGVDAAKQMKIATDALGYSLEDIVWGPKELRDRYGVLIQDQRRMQAGLGPGFEEQMRRIRDVRFEFTRLGVEVEYFGMQFTKSIMDKLFGGPDALDKRLGQLNNWIQTNLPQIADKLASALAPVMREIGALAEKIFTKKNLDWVVNVTVKGLENLNMLLTWLQSDDKWGRIWDKDKTAKQNMNTILGTSKDQVIGDLIAAGRSMGDPNLLVALSAQETGGRFNTDAVNARTGAFGLGQVMPKNWPQGKDPGSERDQIAVMQAIIAGNLKKYGNIKDALHAYYGWGKPGPGEPTFEEYYKSFMQYYNKYQKELGAGHGAYDPTAYHGRGNVDIGGVTVHVAGSHATPQEIASAVIQVIEDRLGRRTQDNLSQFGGVYA